MVKHIVMWRLKDPAPGRTRMQDALEIKRLLEDLAGRIPGLVTVEVGINELPGEDAAELVLYSEFDSYETLRVYAEHPAHVEVAAKVKQLRSERRVIDYQV